MLSAPVGPTSQSSPARRVAASTAGRAGSRPVKPFATVTGSLSCSKKGSASTGCVSRSVTTPSVSPPSGSGGNAGSTRPGGSSGSRAKRARSPRCSGTRPVPPLVMPLREMPSNRNPARNAVPADARLRTSQHSRIRRRLRANPHRASTMLASAA